MRQIAELALLDYDDPEFARDPFAWLAAQARHHRIARSVRGVELLDYQLCRNLFMDRDLGTDHGNLVERMGLPEGSRALAFKRRMLLTQNRGDTRQRLRRALTALIGPSQADAMRGSIAGVVSRLIDGLSGDTVDLRHDFAELVPASVYCSWVDAPPSDARFVGQMSETVLSIFRRDPSLTPAIVAAYDRLFDYVRARLDERRAAPGDDFLSQLIRLHDEGTLGPEELEDFAVMLVEASTDNTANQIAIAVERLTAIPGLWARLGHEPDLVPGAVREAMRLWPRSISTSRTALNDMRIADVEIPAGTAVFACFAAAHRQPDMFEDADSFRPDRPAAPTHMNFGGGAFSCLGQFVAATETEESIAQLAQRFPKLRVCVLKRDFTAMFNSVPTLEVALSG